MSRRLILSVAASLVITATLAVLLQLGPSQARILIAPAWMLGAVIAGDARHPNGPAVWTSLFLMCLAAVYFFPPIQKTKRPSLSSNRQTAELLALYVVLLVEFLCFPLIGTFLLEQTGGSGDVGPAFLFYIFTALLPAFLICGTVLTMAS